MLEHVTLVTNANSQGIVGKYRKPIQSLSWYQRDIAVTTPLTHSPVHVCVFCRSRDV